MLLDHLWIELGHQRCGIGRRLLATCIDAVRDNPPRIGLCTDPPSRGSTEGKGAPRVGERPSRLPGGPVFSVMEFAW